MFLGSKDNNAIIREVKQQGGKKFLNAIYVEKIPHSKENPQECPVCHLQFSGKASWALTDAACAPVFEDRFDSEKCADRAVNWLGTVYRIFLEDYLGSKPTQDDLSEDELRDPVLIGDDETDKQFNARFGKHLDHLAELTPTIALDEERIEDFR